MKLPARIVVCPKCSTRISADSDVLVFLGLGILLGILLALFFCSPARAQEESPLTESPKPKSVIEAPKQQPDALFYAPKPAAKKHQFDAGWWARAHWTSAAFDYATTGNAIESCLSLKRQNCAERDPLARVFVGRYAPRWRLAVGWASESALVIIIPDRKVRRIVQIAAFGVHTSFGLHTFHN